MSEDELLLPEMHAHKGKCRVCDGIVKMFRSDDGKLMPEKCVCIFCGQRYFMVIEDIKAWEIEQWRQKSEDN